MNLISPNIVYTVRVGDKTIQIPEKLLLTVRENVEKANLDRTQNRSNIGTVVGDLEVA